MSRPTPRADAPTSAELLDLLDVDDQGPGSPALSVKSSSEPDDGSQPPSPGVDQMATEAVTAKTDKEAVLDVVRRLPEGASLEQIIEQVETLAAIRRGREQIARGDFIAHEEAKRRLDQWLAR